MYMYIYTYMNNEIYFSLSHMCVYILQAIKQTNKYVIWKTACVTQSLTVLPWTTGVATMPSTCGILLQLQEME